MEKNKCLKRSSVQRQADILAMNDILRITKSIVQRDFDISAFLVAAIFYLIFTFILTNIFNYLEKRFSVYDE